MLYHARYFFVFILYNLQVCTFKDSLSEGFAFVTQYIVHALLTLDCCEGKGLVTTIQVFFACNQNKAILQYHMHRMKPCFVFVCLSLA